MIECTDPEKPHSLLVMMSGFDESVPSRFRCKNLAIAAEHVDAIVKTGGPGPRVEWMKIVQPGEGGHSCYEWSRDE